jgi:hypothetical protein
VLHFGFDQFAGLHQWILVFDIAQTTPRFDPPQYLQLGLSPSGADSDAVTGSLLIAAGELEGILKDQDASPTKPNWHHRNVSWIDATGEIFDYNTLFPPSMLPRVKVARQEWNHRQDIHPRVRCKKYIQGLS